MGNSRYPTNSRMDSSKLARAPVIRPHSDEIPLFCQYLPMSFIHFANTSTPPAVVVSMKFATVLNIPFTSRKTVA